MLKPEQYAELDRIAESLPNIDYVLSSSLLIPAGNQVNSSRAAMTFQQIGQSKNLVHPEIPRVSTGYEKMFGDRSTSYYQNEGRDYIVLKKIRKFDNDMVYALILKDIKDNHYHIVVRNEVESFAESSGVKINNQHIDSLEAGDMVKDGDILYRSNSYDDEMNYCLGTNARAVYLIDPSIVEDAFKISEDLAERLRATEVNQYKIPRNTNDIFLNLYGNSDEYKAFPDIGEKVKRKVLCGRRRVDYSNAQYMMKSKNLRKEMFGDTLYYSSGTVVDIDIYSNVPIEDVPDEGANVQIIKYMKLIQKYWRDLYDELDRIMTNPNNTYSDEIGTMFSRVRDALSIGKKIRWDDDGSIFDNMIIYITTSGSKPAQIGSKLVGRHGNKGVISEIVPKEQMPTDEDGIHAEIQFNALGVIGRLNIAQNNEVEINWIVNEIVRGPGTQKEKFESLLDLLSICNPDQKDLVEEYYVSLKKDERKKFLDEITQDFVVFQPPSKSISFKNYAHLVERFKPKKKRFTIQDAKGNVFNIQRKLIMGEAYIYRLKHEPITKFSVRSKGTINPRTFLPIKSHAYSRGTALFNNQAIRIGNMEMDLLNLCNDPAAINYFTRLYCTSVIGRREFGQLLETNVFTDEMQIDMENYKSRVVDLFGATFLTCGMALEFELGKQKKVKETLMEEILDMEVENLKIKFLGWGA